MKPAFPVWRLRAAAALLLLGLSDNNGPSLAAAEPAVRPAMEKAAATLPAGGFVLAEVSRDQVTFAAAGRPAPREGIAPQDIVFEIGSITKVFTALLLAETVQEGKAALSDPIARHLPAELTLAPEVAAITLEQLATHTSGLPSLPDNFHPANGADPYADYGVEPLYAFLSHYRPAAPAPRPAEYSNLGFGLLGHLLTRIHGLSYAELIERRITGPLGLRDTGIELTPGQAARFAPPHSGGSVVSPWKLDALAGAGALRSTAADLARFAQALLDGRHPALARAWELVRTLRAPFGSRSAQIGLAILAAKRGDVLVYNHSGGTGGFRAYLELVPEHGTATVLLLNNDTLEPAAIVMAARRPPSTGPDPKSRAESPLEPAKLADYAGVYALEGRARFTVLVDDSGRLRIRLTGQAFVPVYHAGSDRFFARTVAAEFQFQRNAAGGVEALTLHQDGREVPARRVSATPPVVRFLSPSDLQAYAGRYTLAPQAVLEVSLRQDTLLVKLTGQPALPVFCDATDHFVYDAVEAALTFSRDSNGAVTAVTLHQNGRDLRAPRVSVSAPKS